MATPPADPTDERESRPRPRARRQAMAPGAQLRLLALALASGLLLFTSDYPVHAWPLQLVALIPVFWGIVRYRPAVAVAARAGGVLGLCYTAPTVIVLELPFVMGAALAVYVSALWAVLVAAAARVLWRPSPLAAMGAGAIAVLVEWVDFTLVPVWGTAQAFVRVWTAAPAAIQFVSVFGVTGLVFTLVAAQALVAVLIVEPAQRRAGVVALAALVVVVVGINAGLWLRGPVGAVRVAAMGWTSQQLEQRGGWDSLSALDTTYRPLLQQAVEQGARLVVSPEVGFQLHANQRQTLLERLGQLAGEHGVWLAVGAFDHRRNDNRLLFFDPRGAVRGEYVKTHLIVGFETYTPGQGQLVVLPMAEARLGGMICQDDNFTDLSRAYGRERVQIMALPTNDWRQVKDHHLENSLFRPVESGYGIVRAASNGISVIASPRGRVLARRDHFAEGSGVIVADVPLSAGGSLYSTLGDWFVAACALGLLAGVGRTWWRQRTIGR